MPHVSVSVPGREILSTGSIVLPRGDNAFRVTIDNLDLDVIFDDTATEPSARSETVGSGAKLYLAGFTNPLGTAYEMPNLATVNGMSISMALTVHTLSGDENNVSYPRLISYTAYMQKAGA
jgi:hypothetical protein